MDESEAQKIVGAFQDIVENIAPNAKKKIMYGGTVYELDSPEPKRLVCGIFVRKNHITIELDGGEKLHDPAKILEGSGKSRRHVVLKSVSDIELKNVKDFVQQSFNLTD